MSICPYSLLFESKLAEKNEVYQLALDKYNTELDIIIVIH